jgi:rhamnulose-1-phosphate aldolase/alcohol dehydrogenase
MPRDLWNDAEAQERNDLEGLVYRSDLLGHDHCLVDSCAGNTSAKLMELDHTSRPVEVLWIQCPGTAMSGITRQGFAGLRLAEVVALSGRNEVSDAELVDHLAHCAHTLDRPRPSVETLLHAVIPAKHADHTHPDAVVGLASTASGRELCQALWGGKAIWVDYMRPGFALGQGVSEAIRAHPQARVLVMGKHGMVTWGDTSRECYQRTIQAIQEVEDFIQSRRQGRRVFAGTKVPPVPLDERHQILAQVLPGLRGSISRQRPAILQVDDSPEVLAFVGSQDAVSLSQIGAGCPEHVIHTGQHPLFVDWTPADGVSALAARLAEGAGNFVAGYTACFEQFSHGAEPMHDPYPRVILIPGLGLITSGGDIQAADAGRQIYRQAIRVMEGSQVLDRFTGLSPQEAHDVEYWPLAPDEFGLRPPSGELAGRVAMVTGGACGIGRATARRLAQDGAHVAILDINLEGARRVADEISARHGPGRSMALHCDVTDEAAVVRAFAQVIQTYGGVDIVVSNAGISIMAPIDETTLDMWGRLMDVLAKGYFLVSREAFRIWKAQQMGGSLIYVSSKNGVLAGKNTASYSAAKAAELHMARCLAEEGGSWGIRVNSVLPYAVMEGTGLWDSGLRQARAASYGIKPEELDEYYRQQTTLKVSVYPENVAEAVRFFAGPEASRTTGGVLTVDGGVGAYVR